MNMFKSIKNFLGIRGVVEPLIEGYILNSIQHYDLDLKKQKKEISTLDYYLEKINIRDQEEKILRTIAQLDESKQTYILKALRPNDETLKAQTFFSPDPLENSSEELLNIAKNMINEKMNYVIQQNNALENSKQNHTRLNHCLKKIAILNKSIEIIEAIEKFNGLLKGNSILTKRKDTLKTLQKEKQVLVNQATTILCKDYDEINSLWMREKNIDIERTIQLTTQRIETLTELRALTNQPSTMMSYTKQLEKLERTLNELIDSKQSGIPAEIYNATNQTISLFPTNNNTEECQLQTVTI